MKQFILSSALMLLPTLAFAEPPIQPSPNTEVRLTISDLQALVDLAVARRAAAGAQAKLQEQLASKAPPPPAH